jgi:hypothetical protein
MYWLKLFIWVGVFTGALAVQAQTVPYQFVTPRESSPEKPWHRIFIDEQARTPAGQPNAGAAWSDFFLQNALNNTLQTTAAEAPWEKCPSFFSWAVWGYLSPDSKFHGDERLREIRSLSVTSSIGHTVSSSVLKNSLRRRSYQFTVSGL